MGHPFLPNLFASSLSLTSGCINLDIIVSCYDWHVTPMLFASSQLKFACVLISTLLNFSDLLHEGTEDCSTVEIQTRVEADTGC